MSSRNASTLVGESARVVPSRDVVPGAPGPDPPSSATGPTAQAVAVTTATTRATRRPRGRPAVRVTVPSRCWRYAPQYPGPGTMMPVTGQAPAPLSDEERRRRPVPPCTLTRPGYGSADGDHQGQPAASELSSGTQAVRSG